MLRGVDRPQYVTEVSAAGAEDDPVRLDSVALTGQSDVSKVIIFPQSSEGLRVLLLVVIPTEAEVLVLHHLGPHHMAGPGVQSVQPAGQENCLLENFPGSYDILTSASHFLTEAETDD